MRKCNNNNSSQVYFMEPSTMSDDWRDWEWQSQEEEEEARPSEVEEEEEEEEEEKEEVASKPARPTCSICLTTTNGLHLRPCCGLALCRQCLTRYLQTKVSEGVALIQCPATDCRARFKEFEVSSNLPSNEARHKFHKFLIDASNDPTYKTCPRCGEGTKVEKEEEVEEKAKAGLRGAWRRRGGRGSEVTCQACALRWCFTCHAPWHEGVTCQEYSLGDRRFRAWTHGCAGQINAQRCPGCQTYIQRSEGCNSMVCARCGVNFCYQCGHNFQGHRARTSVLQRLFLGDHSRKWTPLGCSGSLWPSSPLTRKTVKGLILGAKVLGAVLLPFLLAALALLVIAVAPLYLACVTIYERTRGTNAKKGKKGLTIVRFGFLSVCVMCVSALVLLSTVLGLLYLLWICRHWLVVVFVSGALYALFLKARKVLALETNHYCSFKMLFLIVGFIAMVLWLRNRV
ncbi:E3 ubiquitin-protein ligase RNF217-like isoform X2 [Babylonia areolata]|uniref:E3 ubiquitin-protein ligase RNF217-like isoform X2 n=1 Tax=Babylonia areolata TaxID=304850 RepID=UPI003FD253F5